MGRSRRKDKELDPEVFNQREEIWDKQREYLFSESAGRLRKEKETENRGKSCRKVKELDPDVLTKRVEVPQWPL